ncbi:MAG: hypothetical protein CVU41_12435 [Chloroflexi bacterium HGW-Chloroflexi-3]|nr:MAG: hypothetical protein CVU41_12435 [Chloroflexi bacterium HGW-Chloroflexi-3]
MSNFQIKNFHPDDIPALMQVQQEYARHYPGVQVMPGGIYLPGTARVHVKTLAVGIAERTGTVCAGT